MNSRWARFEKGRYVIRSLLSDSEEILFLSRYVLTTLFKYMCELFDTFVE